MASPDFPTFFHQATGHAPFPYQQQLAQSPQLPEVLHVPTGAGKTAAAILAWLWRRRHHPDPHVRTGTPRRLIYCLPMRTLVEQTHTAARQWLEQLELHETVGLYQLMGGALDDNWLLAPEQEAILVGTQDMLLSRSLNRGYGLSRFRWPMAFGLLNADALWVVDEVQLMGPGLATTLQLDALRRQFGTVGPTQTLWMSATLAQDWLSTVDRPTPVRILQLSEEDAAHPTLGERLRAEKRIFPAEVGRVKDRTYPRRLAARVAGEHQAGTLTLVVLNTVERVQAVYQALEKELSGGRRRPAARQPQQEPTGLPETLLLHSRFRGHDRKELENQLHSTLPPAGRIVVATQVVEAGVDLSAQTLFTELAPWAAMVQRFGRCNRRGEGEGRIFWADVDPRAAPPYAPEDLATARDVLKEIAGQSAAPAALPQISLPPPEGDVLRSRDLIDLFDTAPDLSGSDVDVSRFIRDGRDLDVQVFWRDWDRERTPVPQEEEPSRGELCPVPVHALREFLRGGGRQAWAWDHLAGAWRTVSPGEVRPGQVVLLHSAAGGYRPALGWDPSSSDPVAPVEAATGRAPEVVADDRRSFGGTWVTLAEHTAAVVARVEDLLQALPVLAPWREALLLAARWHDAGKAHPVFQATLAQAGRPPAPASDPALAAHPASDPVPDPGPVWAKAAGPPRRHGRPHFRHELASALALLLGVSDVPEAVLNLAAYLVVAHHGRVRLAIRSLPGEAEPDSPDRRFALGVWEGDELLPFDLGNGIRRAGLQLANLDLMDLGLAPAASPRWLERTLALRDAADLGPFRLAYLEACLRAADARASAAGGLAAGARGGGGP